MTDVTNTHHRERRRQPAQRLVRDQRQDDLRRRERHRAVAPGQELHRAGDDARLARELLRAPSPTPAPARAPPARTRRAARRGRPPSESPCRRGSCRRRRHEQLAPDRVERAVGADHRADVGFGLLHPALVAVVEVLGSRQQRPVADERHVAADRADLVGSQSSGPARGPRRGRGTCWRPRRRRCRSITDSHAVVDRGDLAAPRRELEQPHARRERADDVVGVVDRSVGRHHDVERSAG